MNDQPHLLVVEDEEHLAAGLKLNLELEGYSVDVARNAKEAGEHLVSMGEREGSRGYEVIVLDIMLPDMDGFELCRRLRDAGNFVPVIMLTARASAEDRVRGLEAGADDYMIKPFSLDELLARVRSMLRRRKWEHEKADVSLGRSLVFGKASIDFETHEVLVEGEPRTLTQLELDLVRYFADHPHRVLTRSELLEQVWKLRNHGYTRTVDNFIVRLRRHFEEDPSDPKYFVSVRGAGYRFVPDSES